LKTASSEQEVKFIVAADNGGLLELFRVSSCSSVLLLLLLLQQLVVPQSTADGRQHMGSLIASADGGTDII
jgi:hypothetical protein